MALEPCVGWTIRKSKKVLETNAYHVTIKNDTIFQMEKKQKWTTPVMRACQVRPIKEINEIR